MRKSKKIALASLVVISAILTLHLFRDVSAKLVEEEIINYNELSMDFGPYDDPTYQEYQALPYQNQDDNGLQYAYKPSTKTLSIHDPRSNYTWYSGRDITKYSGDEDLKWACVADSTNCYAEDTDDTGLSLFNSMIIVTVFENEKSIYDNTYGSANAEATVYRDIDNIGHYRIKYDFTLDTNQGKKPTMSVSVHLFLDATGYRFEIKYNEINTKNLGTVVLSQIHLMPFLGSSGGAYYDEYTGTIKEKNGDEKAEYTFKWANSKLKDMTKGYIVVPDGPGSIIPFQRNVQTNLGLFTSQVYGSNYAQAYEHEIFKTIDDVMLVPTKKASMPLYGIVHSDYNSGFLAYATNAEEYMDINVYPDNNESYRYTYAYPSFTYNFKFYEPYNQQVGNQYAVSKYPNKFDIKMRYEFLANENANYSGMANVYRDYLFSANILTPISSISDLYNKIPIRLDFIMADAEYALVGKKDVVVTTADQVKDILKDFNNNTDVDNIVTSLYGWQKGGLTTGKPYEAKFTSSIGTAKEFTSLFKYANSNDVDISFAQDYYNLNSEQISYSGNATKHYNGYFVENTDLKVFWSGAYAKASKSKEWMVSQNKKIRKKVPAKSMTITGVSNNLISNYKSSTLTDSKKYISEGFAYVEKQGKVNADQPNQYLWNYVDRYFNAPVYDSQYAIEQETIPLLQMVLSGSTIEMFADYSNFSFYNEEAILKLIEFNLSPSFLLSKKSSHYLVNTNSAHLYSTELSLYKDKIQNIYAKTSAVLNQFIGDQWIKRENLGNGLVINTYRSGKKVVLNYNSYQMEYNGTLIQAKDCGVF